jgi:hypothetical protein
MRHVDAAFFLLLQFCEFHCERPHCGDQSAERCCNCSGRHRSFHDRKILAEARKRANRDDLDGAAEKYVLYLNTTTAASSAEREEAIG